MDINDVHEIYRLTSVGMSRQVVASHLGVAKSTVQRYLEIIKSAGITPEQASATTTAELELIVCSEPGVRAGFVRPDFEWIYSRHHVRGKRRKTLRELWQSYVDQAGEGVKTLGYKGFCKAYERFCSDLPASCHEIELINTWEFGDVAMIDYSGDGVKITAADGEFTAQVFVAVLPASGYTFCCATPRQTRDDWLDAQVKMLDFFGGVPKHIYLDNSTSLVLKADKYNPKICNEYREFCDYYGTIPVAVRPGKPKDKAAVENAVRWVQVKILSNLHSQKFFDINELNAAMLKELDRFNRHTLTTRTDGFSRWDLMQEERSALRPMPPMPYELSSVSKILKVQKNSVVRLNNCRYSVPHGYVGRKVRVIENNRAQTVAVFDLKSGERIWTHYLKDCKEKSSIEPSHYPPAIRAVMQSKEELVERISQCGKSAQTLCALLLEQNHGEVARKVLRGVNRYRASLGNAAFEECCSATLARSVPSYKVLEQEIEIWLQGNHHQPIPSCDRSGLGEESIRGSGYYEKVLQRRANKEGGK